MPRAKRDKRNEKLTKGNKKTAKKKVSKKVVKKRDLKKEEFLKKLEDMPIIQVVASQTGIHRSTYYRWYEEDPDFKDSADKALGAGVYFVNDMMESLLIKLAKEGKLTAIIFWLKHHSDKYMEMRRYDHFHRHEFEQTPLTEERKEQILRAMKAWDSKDDEDWQDSDYEVPKEEEEEDNSPYDEHGNLKR